MKKQNGLTIWPSYFDAGKKRSEGRRLPIKLAVENPTPTELIEVCRMLSLKAEIKQGKRYPRTWWDDAEAILVETAGTKSKLLKHISSKLHELRRTAQKKTEVQRKPKRN